MSPRSLSISSIISLGRETPIATNDCILTVITKFIRNFTLSTECKTFNMSRIMNDKNLGLFHAPPTTNGLQYDEQIDVSIVGELDSSIEISSGNLKRKMEKRLNRAVNSKTYSAHVKRLEKENIVYKRDTRQRGTKSVFYSLSKEAEKKRFLRIIRTDLECNSFIRIYTALFFKAITEPGIYHYSISDLEKLLSEMHATRSVLVIDHIEKRYSQDVAHMKFSKKEDYRQIPDYLCICYKPVFGVHIREIIRYRKSVQTKHTIELPSKFVVSVPGVSINEFIEKFNYTFEFKSEQVQDAFMRLLNIG